MNILISSTFRHSLMIVLAIMALAGCDQFSSEPKKVANVDPEVKLNTNSMLSSANLFAYTQMSEALTKAQALDSTIGSFLHHPNPLSLEEAQKAWIETYSSYLKISYFWQVPRFEKPQYHEDNDTYKIIKDDLDSWPIEAGYIDYLPLYPLSGIINDLTLKITPDDIYQQHGFSDIRYASIGFHPMEFLLFGENGERSAKDFIPQENNVETINLDTKGPNSEQATSDQLSHSDSEEEAHVHTEPLVNGPQNHNRRREYLRLLSALNVQRLQKLADRWEPAHGYYAKQWRQPQQLENLQRVYQAAVDTVQKEILDLHLNIMLNQVELDDLRSPFSKQDIRNIYDILYGVELLFSTEGGFISEIKGRQADVADKLTAQFKRLLRDMKKLPNDLAKQPLKTRIKRLAPIQQNTIKLLELLYTGAGTLSLPLRELPVSTS